jgi:hypothetical protein
MSTRPHGSRPHRSIPWIALSLATLAACDKPIAVGEINNVMVAAPDSVWQALDSAVEASLAPRAFTVRDERIFEIGQVDPRAEEWSRLRNVRQVLAIGEPADPWISAALEEVDGPVPTPPALVQARNVWAQNQLVTVLLLPPASSAGAAGPLISEAGTLLVSQLEAYARTRMYVSGVDSVLADSLRRAAGFSLMLPDLYRGREVGPGIHEFRNDNPDPATLIRAIEVASRPNGEVPLTADAAREWRGEVARLATDPPQVTEPALTGTRQLTVDGHPALQIQGVWSNPPGEWPAAGLFLSRLVQCPQRTFLVDAWLYAPGVAKYEYLVQLQTILDSFRCG